MNFEKKIKATEAIKTMFLLLSLVSLSIELPAQIFTISGNVKDKKGELLPGVNIYIENAYDGGTSNANGNFSFKTSEKGKQNLVASFIGYQAWKQEIDLVKNIQVNIVLAESTQTLDAVTITAGSFETSDKKRAAVMKPLDIYTTASSNGDIAGAMKLMPGTQLANDDGRLLVRGGEAYETKTMIDGLLASKPYFSKIPDLPTRGRFSPSLFSGMAFNTGGYSAEYGQALSSVLVLSSNDLATEDVTSVSLMNMGAEVGFTKAWKKTSLMLTGSYINLAPFFSLFNNKIDWLKAPEMGTGTIVFRQKINKSGLFKAFITSEYGDRQMNLDSGVSGQSMKITSFGGTTYANFLYTDELSKKTILKTGVAVTYNPDHMRIDEIKLNTSETNIEGKLSLISNLSDGVTLTYGASDSYTKYNQEYDIYTVNFTDHILAAFAEPEIKFSKNFGIRTGLRAEYSTILGKWNLAPRIAMALKTGENTQFSASFGQFYQNPENDFVKMNNNLDFEKADHYIASFQTGKNTERLFRVEGYYKTYSNMIRYSGNSNMPDNILNTGDGYATGLDLFFRDRKSIKGLDYWVSYSYIDTKRLSRWYNEKVTPSYISDNTFSVVSKYFVAKLHSQFGGSFMYASGRPYNDPNSNEFMAAKTPDYLNLSLNVSYLTNLWDNFTIVHLSLTNVLGRDNVYGYRSSDSPNEDGQFGMVPLIPDMKRMFMIGVFITIR